MPRYNGLNNLDLIEQPAGCVEHLLRNIHSERDLVLSESGGAYTCSALRVAIDDYYNVSYFHNVTNNWVAPITDYTGSTKRLYLTPGGSIANGDKFFLTNVNCVLDENSFDILQAGVVETGTNTSTGTNLLIDSTQNFSSTVLPGMTVEETAGGSLAYVQTVDSNIQLTLTDHIFSSTPLQYEVRGKRESWKFARSLTTQQSSIDVLNQLLFESHCMLYKSYNKWRIVDLGDGKIDGTLSIPLRENGKTLVFVEPTPLLQIYNSFVLNYGYDYAKKIYKKRLAVDKNSASEVELDSYKTFCSDAETKWKINRKYEYNSDWIQDDTTAIYFLQRLILWFTYQRMIVKWTGDIQNHIRYELGDRVLINYDLMIPTSKNNSQQFQVIGKTIEPIKKKVELRLLY